MLLWITHQLSQYFHALRVFQYLSFRAILSILTGLSMVLLLSPRFISHLSSLQISQTIRTNGPKRHLKKSGTPTMGGVLIILSILLSVLLWGDLRNKYTWTVLFVMIAFSSIGAIDDYIKVIRRDSDGLSAKWKFILQSLFAGIIAILLYMYITTDSERQLVIPFLKDVLPNLGWLYFPLTYFLIVGSSNAINLTDGLDGLALMPTVMIAGALGLLAYLAGNHVFANYLSIPYIAGAGEMIVFCGALIGAGLGFLWYNTYPAQVFMGDVGSLGLGAALGLLAIIARQEIIYFIMAGVFVVETLSVIIQVTFFKLTGGRRVFRMAPLHHHFELKGWPEPRIIVRFWIITLVLVLCSLVTLKLR